MHTAYLYVLSWNEHQAGQGDLYHEKFAEYRAAFAELRGLAFALDDQELIQLVGKTHQFNSDAFVLKEASFTLPVQQIYTRIAKLLEERLKRQ